MTPRNLSKRERVTQAVQRHAVRTVYVRQNPLDIPLGPAKNCQYMGGRELGPMCGHPSVPGYSYCEEHRAVCYLGRKV